MMVQAETVLLHLCLSKALCNVVEAPAVQETVLGSGLVESAL
jgi:hypothetical protein